MTTDITTPSKNRLREAKRVFKVVKNRASRVKQRRRTIGFHRSDNTLIAVPPGMAAYLRTVTRFA
jgi:hypothetical protein